MGDALLEVPSWYQKRHTRMCQVLYITKCSGQYAANECGGTSLLVSLNSTSKEVDVQEAQWVSALWWSWKNEGLIVGSVLVLKSTLEITGKSLWPFLNLVFGRTSENLWETVWLLAPVSSAGWMQGLKFWGGGFESWLILLRVDVEKSEMWKKQWDPVARADRSLVSRSEVAGSIPG